MFTFFYIKTYAQDTESQDVIQQITEAGLANNDEPFDASELEETLIYYKTHPIDINTATEQDFEKLGILTCFKISMILEYRENHGPFISEYELNGVEGLSIDDLRKLLPYVSVKENNVASNIKLLNRHQFVTTSGTSFPQASGFEKNTTGLARYPGSPYFLKIRYKGNVGKFHMGINAENDAGEAAFNKQTTSFDHYSAYLMYHSDAVLNDLILGDYQANFGQGLVFWSGFSPGKNLSSIQVRKFQQGFNPNRSMDENRYLRGVATKIQLQKFRISLFASSKNIDATQGALDSLGNVLNFTSLKTSGLHRLPPEIRDKKNLGEKIYGSNVIYENRGFEIGYTFCQTHYEKQIVPENTIENKFKFSGSSYFATGINYLVRKRKVEFSGEFARSSNGGNAFSNNINVQLIEELSIALQYRKFDPDYFSAYANSNAQNSKANNEEGIYMAIEANPFTKVHLITGADFYKSLWISSGVNEPKNSAQYFFETQYSCNPTTFFSIRFLQTSTNISNEVNANTQQYNRKARLHANFKISELLECRNRLETTWISQNNHLTEKGYLLYQDVLWKPHKILQFTFRYAFFDTDGWNSRIYTYENDLLYNYSFSPIYGKGTRFYVMSRFCPSKKINLTARYSRTTYFDRESIGSSDALIESNQKDDISFQLFVLF